MVCRTAWDEEERQYKLLNVIEFDSTRKRMSVVVRDYRGQVKVLCKGADNIMFGLSAVSQGNQRALMTAHLESFAVIRGENFELLHAKRRGPREEG